MYDVLVVCMLSFNAAAAALLLCVQRSPRHPLFPWLLVLAGVLCYVGVGRLVLTL